jgi:hypothetical protein
VNVISKNFVFNFIKHKAPEGPITRRQFAGSVLNLLLVQLAFIVPGLAVYFYAESHAFAYLQIASCVVMALCFAWHEWHLGNKDSFRRRLLALYPEARIPHATSIGLLRWIPMIGLPFYCHLLLKKDSDVGARLPLLYRQPALRYLLVIGAAIGIPIAQIVVSGPRAESIRPISFFIGDPSINFVAGRTEELLALKKEIDRLKQLPPSTPYRIPSEFRETVQSTTGVIGFLILGAKSAASLKGSSQESQIHSVEALLETTLEGVRLGDRQVPLFSQFNPINLLSPIAGTSVVLMAAAESVLDLNFSRRLEATFGKKMAEFEKTPQLAGKIEEFRAQLQLTRLYRLSGAAVIAREPSADIGRQNLYGD